jgi:predicted nuclease of predicted toxin-antitoxin system
MKIIADESLNFEFVSFLRSNGFEILSIAEKYPSEHDENILAMSLMPPAIIITEDKDFGELIFKNKKEFSAVILLRYDVGEEKSILKSLLSLLRNHLQELHKSFVTISVNRTRIRFV